MSGDIGHITICKKLITYFLQRIFFIIYFLHTYHSYQPFYYSIMYRKGFGCSQSGKQYEYLVHVVVQQVQLNGTQFNTQTKEQLGGCGADHDILCNNGVYTVPIEIKKINTPDWMQCSIRYNADTGRWQGSERNKIPEKSKQIFENLLSSMTTPLFHGKIPPFILQDITHEEWIKIKQETDDFNDVYMECPRDTIQQLYSYKGCNYIQISEKGLYHLGTDPCNFGVPEFLCDQQLRIRTKIHTTRNKKGFCKLSVIVACQPKSPKIVDLPVSHYTLDNVSRLPANLTAVNTTSSVEE